MPIKKLISKIMKKKEDEEEESSYINLSTLSEAEREIITNTIALKSKNVREIMVPRVDVCMISIESSYDKVIKAFNKERNSRIPVYKDGIDDIVGVLYVKDLVETDEKTFSLKNQRLRGNCSLLVKGKIIYSEEVEKHFARYNAKDILQQYTQGIDKTLPVYKTIRTKGPAHKPVFEVEVEWRGEVIARAEGKTKKEAQQNCAYEACKILGVIK